jgi:hypothetical protein
MNPSHARASARTSSSESCRAAYYRIPPATQQSSARQVHSPCARISNMAPVVVCKIRQGHSDHQSKLQKPLKPAVRKSAKTTVFYTKPKGAHKDTTAGKQSTDSLPHGQRISVSEAAPSATEHAAADVTADSRTAQQPVSRPSFSSRGTDRRCDYQLTSSTSAVPAILDIGGACEPSTESQAAVEATSIAASSEKQHAPASESASDRDSLVVENIQGISAQLDDLPGSLCTSECSKQDVLPAVVKVPSRVKRPWDQVPMPVVQPLIVSEGAPAPSAVNRSCKTNFSGR